MSRETLEQCLEAASWAPSSMNEQPWRYVYALRGEEAFDKLHACLLPGNQPWAGHAAALVLSLAKKTFENGRPNRHHMHDTGAANMLLMLEGVALGVYGHVMGGFDSEKTRVAFDVPDDYDIACVIALGHLGKAEKLEEPFRTRELTPRKRKPLAEIAFHAALNRD